MRRALFALALALLVPGRAAADVAWIGAKLPNGPGQPWGFWVDGHNPHPGGLTVAEVQTAFVTAYQTWQGASCSYLSFESQGVDTSHGLTQGDNLNVMGFFLASAGEDQEYYDTALGGGVAAAAALPLFYSGTIYECDLGMNGVDYTWSTSGAADSMDLLTVALHESGHCLGLANVADENAVMSQFVDKGEVRHGLTQLDANAICGVYPKTGAVGSSCATADCAVGLTCVGSGPTAYCTQSCDPSAATSCPIGFSCDPVSGQCAFGGSGAIKVGAPCTTGTVSAACGLPADAHCVDYDQTGDIWSGGYCTTDCSAHACPDGSTCYTVYDYASDKYQQWCLKDCRSGDDCRYDYACEPVGNGLGRCRPACHTDDECQICQSSDCSQTVQGLCRPCDGNCILAAGGRQVGDSCQSDDQCPAGGMCRQDISDGICVLSCALECMPCPQGTACLPLTGTGELLCFKGCSRPDDCPLGQGCWQLGGESGCEPACQSQDECPPGDGCVNGSCLVPAGADGGCALCNHRDAGEAPGPDASAVVTPPVPSGGCGCQASGAPASGLAALALLFVFRRRTRCRT